jgi:capsid assembly protease
MSRKSKVHLPSVQAQHWFGTTESWDDYNALQTAGDLEAYGEVSAPSEDDIHPMVTMNGSVGIIRVTGPLCSGSAGWAMEFGWACGYEDIKQAVLEAIAGGAKSIVYNLQTGGGAVAGVGACGEFIKTVAKTYPSVGFSDTNCYSAGIWLGVSSGDFRADKYASVGSIGVIRIVEDASKMYENQGVKHDVIRSAPLKGIGNGVEALSSEARAYLQKGVDEAAGQFIDHVSTSLRLPRASVEKLLATGETWYAEEAMGLGLVKKIQTLDQIVVELQKKTSNNTPRVGSIVHRLSANHTPLGDNMSKVAPTSLAEAEALAEASAFADVEAEAIAEPEANVKDVKEVAAALAVAPDPLMTLYKESQASVVAYAAKEATLVAKVADLEALVVGLRATEDSVKPFLATYINGMQIKSGGSAQDASLLVAQSVSILVNLAEGAKQAFHSKIGQPGAKSVKNIEAADNATDVAVSNLERHRLGLSTL